jgi:uncharacterized protein
MTVPYGDEETARSLLQTADVWAVVGLSTNSSRAAYGVAHFLQTKGKRIVPVHPHAETVHGQPGFATLADVPFPIDVVDVFVNSSLAGGIADEALAVGARGVWFQLRVVDTDAYDRVTKAGVPMVMDRCPAIEWPRLIG